MTRKLDAIRAAINADPQRRERVNQHKQAMHTALALGKLRETRDLTQKAVAQRLAVSQANVSRIEREDDLYISTLRGYVQALGGELELRAVFPDMVVLFDEAQSSQAAEPPAEVQAMD